MLSASVYCVYPRNKNSSNKPTKTKKTAPGWGVNKARRDVPTAESEHSHEGRVHQQAPAAAHSLVVQENLAEDSVRRRSLKMWSGRGFRQWFEIQQSPRENIQTRNAV